MEHDLSQCAPQYFRKGQQPRDTPQEHGVKFFKSLTVGSRTLVYGKNDPFRSWPISANELEEVAMGSETNV
jgi:hypothetical protein